VAAGVRHRGASVAVHHAQGRSADIPAGVHGPAYGHVRCLGARHPRSYHCCRGSQRRLDSHPYELQGYAGGATASGSYMAPGNGYEAAAAASGAAPQSGRHAGDALSSNGKVVNEQVDVTVKFEVVRKLSTGTVVSEDAAPDEILAEAVRVARAMSDLRGDVLRTVQYETADGRFGGTTFCSPSAAGCDERSAWHSR